MTDARTVYRRQVAYCALLVVAAGGVGGCTLVLGSWPAWYELAGFALAACLLGSRTIRISPTLGTVSVGFIFVFAALAQLGPIGGITAGVASVLGATVMCPLVCAQKRRPNWLVVASNAANVVLAAGAAGWAYRLLESAYLDIGIHAGVLPAFIVIGAYYMINSSGFALMASADGRRTPIEVWSENLSWTVLPFYVGGAVVIVVNLIAATFGPHLWLLLIPPVLGIHIAMDLRTKARIAQHVAEGTGENAG